MTPRKMTLPTDSKERKNYPMFRGLLGYAPAALAGIARHSFEVGARHTAGEEMHHARGKSGDHGDCIIRHLADIGDMLAAHKRVVADSARMPLGDFIDNGGPEYLESLAKQILAEANALGWRAVVWGQELHEEFGGAPLAPSARLPVPDDGHSAVEIVALIAGEGDELCTHRLCVLKPHAGPHVDAEIAKLAYRRIVEAEKKADEDHLRETFGPIAPATAVAEYEAHRGHGPLADDAPTAIMPALPEHTCAIGSTAPCWRCDSERASAPAGEQLTDMAGADFDPAD